MRDMQPFSDVVVLAIKAAMAPVLERLAVVEQMNRDLQARAMEVAAIRDRVTAVETKTAQPVVIPPVDLSAVFERLDVADERVKAIEGLRDRVAAVEAIPRSFPLVMSSPADLELMMRNLVDPVTKDVSALRERVTAITEAVETGLREREHRSILPAGPSAAELDVMMRDKVEPLAKDLSAVRERLAVVETREPVPGPAGPKGADGANGKDGADGTNGKDGANGLGFDDVSFEHDGERVVTIKWRNADQLKTQSIVFPCDLYRGVYVDGRTYDRGDGVTWAGSEWHCNETTTTKPGEGSKAWTLKVKRGRDGKDGRDAAGAPVVTLGR